MPNSSDSIDPKLHRQFTELIAQRTGIVMDRDSGPFDPTRLMNRLSRALKRLGLLTFEQLWHRLARSQPNSAEWIEFIHVVSTHKTDFFREPAHFDRLAEHAARLWANNQETVRVWSAACSTGEEAVSVAITLQQTSAANQGGEFQILATDLDSVVIEQAKTGIYPKPDLSRAILKEHFLEGRREHSTLVRVKDRLLANIRYEPFNLLHTNYPPVAHFDAVFCRNVLIYFEASTRNKIVTKLAETLAPNGMLFFGHSESFSYRQDLECVAPTVYRNRKSASLSSRRTLQGSIR